MKHLTAPQIAVVDLAAVGPCPHLPMKIVDVSSMTALGKECRERAIIEGQRRLCGSDSDVVLDENKCPPVKCSDCDLHAVILDLRLVCGNFLSRPQRELAVRQLKEAYIAFSTKAWHHNNTVLLCVCACVCARACARPPACVSVCLCVPLQPEYRVYQFEEELGPSLLTEL